MSGDEGEDELVTWVSTAPNAELQVHWVVGEGCELGRWPNAEPAPKDHRPRLPR
jgi:hypothetical protein